MRLTLHADRDLIIPAPARRSMALAERLENQTPLAKCDGQVIIPRCSHWGLCGTETHDDWNGKPLVEVELCQNHSSAAELENETPENHDAEIPEY